MTDGSVPEEQDREDRLEKLVDRFEKVARVRAETGQLDAPAAKILAGTEATPKRKRTAAPTPPVARPEAPEVATPATPPEGLNEWWAAGERVAVTAPHPLGGSGQRGRGGQFTIFTRVLGTGPWLTAIHGFPSSSWDWEPVSRELRRSHRILALDLLGFGDSDKPRAHDWNAFEQADIIEALWRHFGVNETRVVAHDVGLTVALELLARQEEGRLAARVTDFTLLNGGAYAGFHRPVRIQQLLQKPLLGPIIARLLSENKFSQAFSAVFAPTHRPTPEELHQHWESVVRRDGSRNYHRLIKYIAERRVHAHRWESALQQTRSPIRFVWGMADPVSGAHMAEVIKQRRPGADIVELSDVGHYPQLEAPDRVVTAIEEGK